jgi:hypothetical protein
MALKRNDDYLTDEQREELWAAVRDAVEAKQDEIGQRQMRSTAYWGQDGRSCLVYGDCRDKDGTLYRVQAEGHLFPNRQPWQQEPVKVEAWPVLAEPFWDRQLADRSNAVVIDHTHYRVLPDGASGPREMSGFAGRLFRIRYLDDGRVVESRNVWFQGQVPPAYWDRIPDNAVFLQVEKVAR